MPTVPVRSKSIGCEVTTSPLPPHESSRYWYVVITPREGSTHFLEGHLLPDKTIAHSPHLLKVISGLCLIPNPCTPNQLSHLLHQVQNPSSTIPKALLHAHFSFSAMWYKSVAPTHISIIIVSLRSTWVGRRWRAL